MADVDPELRAQVLQLLDGAAAPVTVEEVLARHGAGAAGAARTARRGRRPDTTMWRAALAAGVAVVAAAGVLVGVALSDQSQPALHRPPLGSPLTTVTAPGGTLPASPAFADDWLLVAPGGGTAATDAPSSVDLLDGATGKLTSTGAFPGGGSTVYPWATSGTFVAGVRWTETDQEPPPGEGVAWAFSPAAGRAARAVRLGPAELVFAGSQPDSFWLASARAGTCEVTLVVVAGGRAAAGLPHAYPCGLHLLAWTDAGFLAMTTRGGPTSPLEIWSPVSGVVRHVGGDEQELVGAIGDTAVFYPTAADTGDAFEVVDLASGATRRVTLLGPAGTELWGTPQLSPSGTLLAALFVTPATAHQMARDDDISPPCCVAPSLPGRGTLELLTPAGGRVALTRPVGLSTDDELAWSPDGEYVFIATGTTTISVVPAWSPTAAVETVTMPIRGPFADVQEAIAVERELPTA